MRVIVTAIFFAVLASLAAPDKAYAQSSAGADQSEPESESQTKDKASGSVHPTDRLANQATNPAAALIQLQLQNQFIPNSNNSSGYANSFVVQPVIPFSLGEDSYFQNFVTRTTLPLVTTPDPDGPVSDTTDLGDATVIGFAVNKQKVTKDSGFEWGPGLAAILPTATDDRTGADKWSLGPGFLGIAMKADVLEKGDSLMLGAYGYNVWSVAGDGDREDVNKLFAAPVVIYHFAELADQKGWYAGYSDELWNFDWKDDGRASMPIGGRVGRVFSVAGQPINLFLQSDYWVADRGTDPVWDIKLSLTFLFPE
jgi:hypothetical protein